MKAKLVFACLSLVLSQSGCVFTQQRTWLRDMLLCGWGQEKVIGIIKLQILQFQRSCSVTFKQLWNHIVETLFVGLMSASIFFSPIFLSLESSTEILQISNWCLASAHRALCRDNTCWLCVTLVWGESDANSILSGISDTNSPLRSAYFSSSTCLAGSPAVCSALSWPFPCFYNSWSGKDWKWPLEIP